MLDRLLSGTNSLSQQLQDRKIDFSITADLVFATIETLEEFFSEKSWNLLYDYSKQLQTTHVLMLHFRI